MFFVGHTRFSLFQPGSSAWATTRDGGDDATALLARLYAPERMEPRAAIFFNHLLPTLDLARAGHEVRHIVSYSAEMPDQYRTMMVEAGQKYPWLVLDEHVNGQGSKKGNYHRTAATLMGNRGDIYGTYRVDDDDILPVDYFTRVTQHMRSHTVGSYVSLGMGVTALWADGGYVRPFRCVVQRMFSAGHLAVCANRDGEVTCPPGYPAHNRADEAAPVIMDSRRPGFLWTRTTGQDTARGATVDDLRAELGRLPEADAEQVAALFPTLA